MCCYATFLLYSPIILAFTFKYVKNFFGDSLEHKLKAYYISFLFSALLISEIGWALNYTKTFIILITIPLQLASAERFRNA